MYMEIPVGQNFEQLLKVNQETSKALRGSSKLKGLENIIAMTLMLPFYAAKLGINEVSKKISFTISSVPSPKKPWKFAGA